tara:strand:+ start:2520 stop:2750 length:231 start_codon:yes stop_codon:yes gene_type:complete
MKSKIEKLELLWELLTDSLIQRMRSGEATAQDLGIVRQLLKDHDLNVDASEEGPIAELGELIAMPYPLEDEKKSVS